MTMIHLQRSLLSTTTASATSFTFSSPTSALHLRHFMLQFRAIRSSPNTNLSHSTLGLGSCIKCQKFSQIKFGGLRVSRTISTNHITISQSFHPLSNIDDGSRCAVVLPALARCKFMSSLNNFTSPSMAKGISRCWTIDGIFPRRFFSHSRKVANKNDNISTQDGEQGKLSLGVKSSNKRKKEAKAFIAHGKNRAVTSTSVSKDVDTVTSRETKVNVKKGELLSTPSVDKNKQESKVTGKKKTQSGSKKNNRLSVSNSSEQVAEAQSSKCSSEAGDIGQSSSNILKKNSAESTSEEVSNSSTSKKNQSKKKSGNSGRKEKSIIAVNGSKKGQKLYETNDVKPPGQSTLKTLYPATGKSLVIVESVTKAKVIQGFLGDMFEVLPSYGHVRDLAARSGSVRPDDDFRMVWEVPSASWTHLKSIKVALSGAENLILASDPDREGEAIAWHIFEMLQQQDALHENISVGRVVFHEITEQSIKSALNAPRNIDVNLVNAYLARRALDYLIGFNISPLLWRKLPGCQSAGRVQSAALSLICDREMEIDEFKPQEYWTVEVQLNRKNPTSNNDCWLPAHLTHFDSKKLSQFSIRSQMEAQIIEQKMSSADFHVISLKKSKPRRNPPTPYITSTLQQDAANKLHFTASYTMMLAQKLYEGVELSDGKAVGLITYIRTDGLHISDEALANIRSLAIERYGKNGVPENARKYFKKVKNAQEAHEAIRPTDIRRLPSMLAGRLDEDSLKLYTLIWSRTVACQMEPAIFELLQLDIGNSDESIVFRSSSSRVNFPGYQAVFKDTEAEVVREKEDDSANHDEAFALVNALKEGDPLHLGEVELKQHHTQPPPRYSEASLVKKLEELGIGRPSTYASTLKVLQDRNYVTVKSRVLYPEFRGRMVSAFLSHHFTEVTDYSFTADMETELDNVSAGSTDWKVLLKDYWTRLKSYCERASNVHIHQVEKMLEKKFGDYLFTSLPDQSRVCPSCSEGTLIFKVSRFGAGYFIGCDQHPKCKYIAKTLYGEDEEEEDTPNNNIAVEEPKLLGVHPNSKEKVLLKHGPYGFYVQLGEDRKGYIPKRASLSHIKDVGSVTLEDALELLRYPLKLGDHPKDGQPVLLKIGKVGFSVRHRRTMASVPKNMKPNDVTLEKALKLLSSDNVRRCGRPKSKGKVETLETF
ncbi:hypothetical protein L6164_024199 [Bauhinia variegata]|uniref:Uncharacterized protein n=1 Tax=Bauhinia variegata TaxID=167791 RepID=A0ACB9LY01_BAUVA|nr:hypothetical protein L6164_024199 [Bauhinia variegata]